MYSIFIIDDDPSARNGISLYLRSEYKVRSFQTVEEALGPMREDPPDIVLLDIGLPGINGIEALPVIKNVHADAIVIMITAFEEVPTIVAAMRSGAYDYMVKPLQMEALEITIRNALEKIRMRKEIRVLHEKEVRENIPCFISKSLAIQEVMELINRAAQSGDTPVLLSGETGTGKELLASAIHYKSPNSHGPFVVLNCAALPKELTESELFGYEKGAFTGADTSGKKGLVEQAAEGTLFLDEIGDLSVEAQAKLLRFLENGEFYRVGGLRKRSVRARVISATNKNLEALIEKDLFRRDLYYRLAVIKMDVPSLNERRDDIMPIALYYLKEFSNKFGKVFSGISPGAEAALKQHHWKGNVRELKNLIERGTLLGDGPELTVKDLGLDRPEKCVGNAAVPVETPPIPPDGLDLDAVLSSIERYYVAEALKATGGNESRAARLLNMNYYTFRNKKKKYL